jgi:hypothetical protein
VDHEIEVFEPKMIGEARQVLRVLLGGVAQVGRPLGEAKPEVIGSDAAESIAKRAHQVAVLEGPGGRAVNEEEGVAGALVEVVHPPRGELRPAMLERIGGAVQPIGDRRRGGGRDRRFGASEGGAHDRLRVGSLDK